MDNFEKPRICSVFRQNSLWIMWGLSGDKMGIIKNHFLAGSKLSPKFPHEIHRLSTGYPQIAWITWISYGAGFIFFISTSIVFLRLFLFMDKSLSILS